MDIGFLREWAATGEVHVGSALMRSISQLSALRSLSTDAELIPNGYQDAGFEIFRYDLMEIRYPFAAQVADLLAGKCSSIAQGLTSAEATSDIHVLLKLLGYVLDKHNTHFELG